MDLYSIQNSGGEVYGVFPMIAEDDLDPSEWEGRLTEELNDILGINGVRSGKVEYGGIEYSRVVIDLDPIRTTFKEVDRVHLAVGHISLVSSK